MLPRLQVQKVFHLSLSLELARGSSNLVTILLMVPHQNPAFLPVIPLRSSHVTPRSAVTPRRAHMRMVASPDDTAVDMLTFALSGPGIVSFAAFFSITGAIAFNYFEFGPRRPRAVSTAVYLRVFVPSPRNLELSDGSVRALAKGKTLLRFDSREIADAVARRMRAPGVLYTMYKLDGVAVRTLSTWPRDVNVPGVQWPSDVVDEDTDDAEARWVEYEQIGNSTTLDKQWKDFVEKLGGVTLDNPEDECRLCGGTGTTRCNRCGGAPALENRSFDCDCKDGRRPCEWCRPNA